jgi:hypothetical protein
MHKPAHHGWWVSRHSHMGALPQLSPTHLPEVVFQGFMCVVCGFTSKIVNPNDASPASDALLCGDIDTTTMLSASSHLDTNSFKLWACSDTQQHTQDGGWVGGTPGQLVTPSPLHHSASALMPGAGGGAGPGGGVMQLLGSHVEPWRALCVLAL